MDMRAPHSTVPGPGDRRITSRSASRLEGRITEVWDLEGYGRVETEDGASVRCDRSGVARGHFARLLVGSEVTFERLDGVGGDRAERLRVVRDPKGRFRT